MSVEGPEGSVGARRNGSPRDKEAGSLVILPRPQAVAPLKPNVNLQYKVVEVHGYKLDIPSLDEKTFDDGQPFPNVEPDTNFQFGMQDDELNDVDVLCGRGGMTNAHPGNVHFRHLVNYYRVHYGSVKKRYKSNITKTIVTVIRDRHGRFLRKSEKDGLWYEVGDLVARDKTAQTLREGLARLVRSSLAVTHKRQLGKNGTSPSSVSVKLNEQAQVRMVIQEARKRWHGKGGEEKEEKVPGEQAIPKRMAEAFTPEETNPTKRARREESPSVKS